MTTRNHICRQVIIHMGFAKTGTSALQRALFDSRSRLWEMYKVLYPGENENHHFFQGLFVDHPEELFQSQLHGLKNTSKAQSFYESYRRKILNEIYEKKPDRIILSSEYLSEMNEEEQTRMRHFLESIAREITPLVYVRDPWSWAISLRQEQIRTGWIKNETRVDYTIPLRGLIERIETGIGRKVIVAPYMRRSDGFDVVEDFFSRCGCHDSIPSGDSYSDVRAGMNREAATLLLRMNHLYPVFDEQKRYIVDPVRSLMSNSIQTCPRSTTPIHISRKTARLIHQQSKADMKFVEDNYFFGKMVFSLNNYLQDLIEFDDKLSLEAISREDITDYLLSCIHSLAEQVGQEQGKWRSFKTQLAQTEKQAQSLARQLEEKTHHVQMLTQEVTQKDESVRNLSGELSNRNERVNILSQELSQRNKKIALQEDNIVKQGMLLKQKDADLFSLFTEISEIKASNMWKVAQFIHRLRLFLVPENSWRERMMRKIIPPGR